MPGRIISVMHTPGNPATDPIPVGVLPSVSTAPISVALLADAGCPEAAEVVACWEEHLATLKRDFEIFVVGPESSTDLGLLREALSVQETRLQVVTYSEPQGAGPALRTALATARHPLLLCLPCDRQYHPKDLDRFLTVIDEVHMVCGYRVFQRLPGWLSWFDLTKRFLSRVLLGAPLPPRECWLGWSGWRRRLFARWILGLRLQDVECQFRLLRTEFIRPIPIQSQGFFAHVELLAKANHLECIMAEVPVSWTPPEFAADDPYLAADRKRVMRDAEFVPRLEASYETVAQTPSHDG